MLDTTRIEQAMQAAGLNQAAIATKCGVSREAVSRWFAGESIPRPSKLALLANALALQVPELFVTSPGPSVGLVGAEDTGITVLETRDALQDLGWRLRDLSAFVPLDDVFEPPLLRTPSTGEEYLNQVCSALKRNFGLARDKAPTILQLLGLCHSAGVVLAPMPWLGDRPGQGNELHVRIPENGLLWLVFGTKTPFSALRTSLAFALGLVYGRAIQDEVAKHEFARAFARELAPPRPADTVTVEEYFLGDIEPSFSAFVEACERNFKTPLYTALAEYQRYAGGRDPAFIASALNIGLADAVQLSFVLSDVAPNFEGGPGADAAAPTPASGL